MINLNDLTTEEIFELEKQIQKYKQNITKLYGYRVTICVLFDPEKHENDSLGDIESFEEWLVDAIPDSFIKPFNFNSPEIAILDQIEQMEHEEVQGLFEPTTRTYIHN